MEFNQKLQELRKQKNLTQDELAEKLFVSRTAISKWESGRGYPNIESLKAISNFFGITVDHLLSSEELLALSQEDHKKKETLFLDLLFGLLDLGIAALLFLPFFGQEQQGIIQSVSLLSLRAIPTYLKICYHTITFGMILFGVLTLSLQNFENAFWGKIKHKISFLLNTIGALLFVISNQPYPATFLLIFLIIKVFIFIKKP